MSNPPSTGYNSKPNASLCKLSRRGIAMMRLIELLFSPPPMPDLILPLPARLLPHVKLTIQKACELFYYRGCFDGFIFGVLVALLFMQSRKARRDVNDKP